MQIEVFHRRKPVNDSQYERAIAVANDIREFLESKEVGPLSNIATSKQIRDAVSDYMKRNSWIPDFKFDSSIPESEPNTNYRIDFIKDISEPDGILTSRFLFEACFDNRQAIGTNILKFELAKRAFEKHPSKKTISLILAADKKSLKQYGWDGSIGSFEEYELALRDPYSSVVTFEPIFLIVRG